MIRLTVEFNPAGRTAEERFNSLVSLLRAQNEQLRAIVKDQDERIRKLEEKEKKNG